MSLVELDGAQGEGGGRIVRSARTPGMLTGRPGRVLPASAGFALETPAEFAAQAREAALQARGASARAGFEDPDVILVGEVAGSQAGLAAWSREDRARHPFPRPD